MRVIKLSTRVFKLYLGKLMAQAFSARSKYKRRLRIPSLDHGEDNSSLCQITRTIREERRKCITVEYNVQCRGLRNTNERHSSKMTRNCGFREWIVGGLEAKYPTSASSALDGMCNNERDA
jgi:hypothetical protein